MPETTVSTIEHDRAGRADPATRISVARASRVAQDDRVIETYPMKPVPVAAATAARRQRRGSGGVPIRRRPS
ncbi:hypothetical protein [Micromonospora globbae]|uniref:hypothetical protein n=1 Tax=Micromonospora globbae TaxID=1894969 RepID=UPI0011C37FFA|nr:hypothetical protein [Micromonospora globbae]